MGEETVDAKSQRKAASRRHTAAGSLERVENALIDPEAKTAFDVFGSELPDKAFAGVFDQPRQRGWREVDL